MALQSTGPISLSQINAELGRSATATINLDTAENGSYVALNSCSPFKPDAANSASMSEWYGYCHACSCPEPYGPITVNLFAGKATPATLAAVSSGEIYNNYTIYRRDYTLLAGYTAWSTVVVVNLNCSNAGTWTGKYYPGDYIEVYGYNSSIGKYLGLSVGDGTTCSGEYGTVSYYLRLYPGPGLSTQTFNVYPANLQKGGPTGFYLATTSTLPSTPTSVVAFTPPGVTTITGSSITATSFGTGGNVYSNGGSSVTSRGVCYNTSPDPTTANSSVYGGTGTGGFTVSITGLSPSTTYYVRAYAVNSKGTGYGNQVTVTTSAAAGSLYTYNVSSTYYCSGFSCVGDTNEPLIGSTSTLPTGTFVLDNLTGKIFYVDSYVGFGNYGALQISSSTSSGTCNNLCGL